MSSNFSLSNNVHGFVEYKLFIVFY